MYIQHCLWYADGETVCCLDASRLSRVIRNRQRMTICVMLMMMMMMSIMMMMMILSKCL